MVNIAGPLGYVLGMGVALIVAFVITEMGPFKEIIHLPQRIDTLDGSRMFLTMAVICSLTYAFFEHPFIKRNGRKPRNVEAATG